MVRIQENEKLPDEFFVINKKNKRVGTKNVCVSMEKAQYNFCIDQQNKGLEGWGWADIMRAGIRAKINPSNLEEEIAKLRERVNALSNENTAYKRRFSR